MQKKLFAIFAIIISVVFTFSVCFAADGLTEATNAVKDAVNNTEGAVEGAMHNAGDAIKDTTEKAENTMENAGNKIEGTGNTVERDMSDSTSRTTSTNNGTYMATRTSTNGNATFMGMSATAWTWLILGIAAIGIISVVWYYTNQLTAENNHSRKD